MPEHARNEWVGAYTRKSRAMGDHKDPTLMETHRQILKRLAGEDGVALTDDDIRMEVGSGERIADRPVFTRLLDELEHLPPDTGGVLYCTEFARLSRGRMSERGRIMDALIDAGIRIRTPQRAFDLSEAYDEQAFESEGQYARRELRQNQIRMKNNRDERTRQGKILTGAAPWGYQWSRYEGKLLPAEPAFSMVEPFFVGALHQTCRQLGAAFGLIHTTAARVLRNPVYTGWPHRHYKLVEFPGGRRGTTRIPQEEWMRSELPGDYPAAISWVLFERVQKALDSRRNKPVKYSLANAWSRDVVRFTDARGERFDCTNVEKIGAACYPAYAWVSPGVPKLYIARSLVHDRVVLELARVFSSPEVLHAGMEAYIEQQEQQAGQETEAGIRRRIVRLRSSLDDLLSRELEADHPEERASLARVRAQKHTELDSLLEDLQTVTVPKEAIPNRAVIERYLGTLGDGFYPYWEALPEHQRRALVNACIAKVDVLTVPVPGQQSWRREVVGVERQPWISTL